MTRIEQFQRPIDRARERLASDLFTRGVSIDSVVVELVSGLYPLLTPEAQAEIAAEIEGE